MHAVLLQLLFSDSLSTHSHNHSLHIFELSAGVCVRITSNLRWVEDYKKFLHTLVERGDVLTFKEGHTEETPHFTVTFAKGALDKVVDPSSSRVGSKGKVPKSEDGIEAEDERLYKYLKLDTHFATTNMVSKNRSEIIWYILHIHLTLTPSLTFVDFRYVSPLTPKRWSDTPQPDQCSMLGSHAAWSFTKSEKQLKQLSCLRKRR